MENSSPESARVRGTVLMLSALALVALLVCVGVYLQSPPAAVADGAPPEVFSSGRAMRHVQTIARRPHPLGSAEHAVVRDYLLKELTALGLRPELQETTATTHGWNGNVAATVQNVVATLPGAASGKPLLLVAHYDSVSTGPGASDDGAGVAAVLETLRALKSAPQLKNDVVALLTDGEEAGLLGADAFVEEHPLAKNVGLVINLEARGNSGPSLMFETSDDNGWLISEVAKASDRPVTNSLLQDLYQKLLLSDTDLSVFKTAGLPGLNFAYIGGDNAYHSALDTPDRIDQRSLQNQGAHSLALARHFGNLDLADTRRPPATYFNPAGRSLIHYGQWLVLPLSIVVLVAFLALLVWGFMRGRLRVLGVVLGFVGMLLSVVVAAVLTRAVLWLALRGGGTEGPFVLGYDRNLYAAGFAALTFAVASLFYLWFRRRANAASLMAGGMLWWALLMLATSLLLPGAAYVFTWPLLCGLCGLAVVATDDARPALWQVLGVLALGIMVPTLLLAPLTHLILSGLSLSLAGGVMLLVALLSWLLIPQLEFICASRGATRRWLMPVVALVLGVACLAAALVRNPRNGQEPTPDGLFYVLDASKNRAVFASLDEAPDEFTTQYLTESPARGGMDDYLPSIYGMYLKKETAVLPLDAPRIELISETREGDTRTVKLRVSSPRGAPALSVYLDPQAKVLEASVNAKPLVGTREQDGEGARWSLNYSNPGPQGFELTLKTQGAAPLNITAVDQSYELPSAPNTSPKPRPDYIIPATFPLTDSTLVTKSYSF
jgi:Peptidase family M28